MQRNDWEAQLSRSRSLWLVNREEAIDLSRIVKPQSGSEMDHIQ